MRTRVDELFVRWLRHPASFGASMGINKFIQHTDLLIRLTELLSDAHLDVQADRSSLERFLDWVETWFPDRKSRLAPRLQSAASRFPAPGLWERVNVKAEYGSKGDEAL